MSKSRTPYYGPPHYDIDVLLDVDRTTRFVPDKIVDKIWEAIDDTPKSTDHDYFRPDSSLLAPEVMLRDICVFNCSMGNGWVVSLGYSGGLLCFFRGLRALRTIGHAKGLEMAETVLAALNQYGIPDLATAFADDPNGGWQNDSDFEALLERFWEVEETLDNDIGSLDQQWWRIDRTYWDQHKTLSYDDPPLFYTLCEYLDKNKSVLRSRVRTNVA